MESNAAVTLQFNELMVKITLKKYVHLFADKADKEGGGRVVRQMLTITEKGG